MVIRQNMPLREGYKAPAGFDLVDIGVVHPLNGMAGVLLRNERTGIYVMDAYGAGSMVSVPPAWAVEVASESGYIGAAFA